MNKATVNAIRKHAEAEYPNEACGLVVKAGRKERYVPCRNKNASGNHFVMHPEDYADAEEAGEIIAVVHSHPDHPAKPSEADIVSCETSGLPWLIAEVREGKTGEIVRIEPKGYEAPLLGRMFFHGVLDCYSLVKDVYQRERGIELPEPEREDGWWEGEAELYLDNFAAAGFREVTDGSLEPFDVILMQLRSKRTNHAGVYLGDTPLSEAPNLHRVPNAMIHHRYGRLSERVVYGGYWRDITRMVIRYDR